MDRRRSTRTWWARIAAAMTALAGMGVCGWAAADNSTPYTGAPVSLPGTVQASNFDNGGEGVAYYDTTPGNAGGAYRQTDVDIQADSEGGYNIGWIAPAEWLNYTVSVATAGAYTAQLRVASPTGGALLHVGFNGPSNVWTTVSVPATGGWQTWTTVSIPVTLGAGAQQITLYFDTGGFNISYVTVVASTGGSPTGGATGASTPYSGTPAPIPGTIQAANFDNGGERIAYYDTTPGNTGGAYRQTDADIQADSEGGYNIGWIAATEWLNYTVTVATAGSYTAQLRVASPSGGTLHIGFNGPSNVWTTVSIPVTGGWQTWTTVTVPVTLGTGQQLMTLYFDTGGFNISSVTVASPSTAGSTGSVITVNAGGDLQAALNAAQPGQTIALQAGATFTGNFILPATPSGSTSYITVRSAAEDSALPPSGVRMSPSYSAQLPILQSPNSAPALMTAPGAHGWILEFLEFAANYQGQDDMLDLGDGSSAQNTLSLVPYNLIVDRVYMQGNATYGQKRAIGLNSASTTIMNSYIAGIMASGLDTQAICGWNGPGPYTITNNYLEAAGENILFGGADPSIPNLVPSNITVTGNYLTKQLAWESEPQYNVKNLFELKNAQRVVVSGNVMEYSWLAAQSGYAVVFTPRNQGGTAPWSVVQQVQFTNNVVRHVSSGINILGADNDNPSQELNNVTIQNNLFLDVSAAEYGGDGRFVLIEGGVNVTINHNTVFEDGTSALYAATPPAPGFVFTNNIVPDNSWAVMGGNEGPGSETIAYYFPNSQFLDNIFAGSNPALYPTGNYYPPSYSAVGFVNLTVGNYRLLPGSPYHGGGTDGTDVGCNIDALDAAAGTTY
jgi:hypothetical protein